MRRARVELQTDGVSSRWIIYSRPMLGAAPDPLGRSTASNCKRFGTASSCLMPYPNSRCFRRLDLRVHTVFALQSWDPNQTRPRVIALPRQMAAGCAYAALNMFASATHPLRYWNCTDTDRRLLPVHPLGANTKGVCRCFFAEIMVG
jgi:hypothetical protein